MINNKIGFEDSVELRQGETWKLRIELSDAVGTKITLSTGVHDLKVYNYSEEMVWDLQQTVDFNIVDDGLNILSNHSLTRSSYRAVWKIVINGLTIINKLKVTVR